MYVIYCSCSNTFRKTDGWPLQLRSNKTYESGKDLEEVRETNPAFVSDETSHGANIDVTREGSMKKTEAVKAIVTPKRIPSIYEDTNGVSGIGFDKKGRYIGTCYFVL